MATVRLATPQDEPAISRICAAAFFDEGLFGDLIHPHRHLYPDDSKIFWATRTRKSFLEPRNLIIVATLIENGEEKIVGMSTWQRQGDDPGAQKIMSSHQDPEPNAFVPLPSLNNRAIDPTKATILQDAYPYFSHHWSGLTNGLPRSNNWYLNLCCIDPAYQKRGVGKPLVQWGLQKAREENVHASVTTSYQNEQFYLRCGFDEIVGSCTEGEGNPLKEAGVRGGEILWMWAKGPDEAQRREMEAQESKEEVGGEVPRQDMIAVVPS
jgi:predicted GNAT family acetyltransferase